VRAHKALFHISQFGYSEGYCSTQRRRRRDFRDFHGSPCCRDTKVVGTLNIPRDKRKEKKKEKKGKKKRERRKK